MRLLLPFAALVALLAGPSPASADTLLVPVEDGRNLTAGDGLIAWAQPAEGGRGWRLAFSRSTGTVAVPALRSFGAAPDPAIGKLRGRVVIVYSRCAGTSATRGCDVYAYDVRARRERRIPELATRAWSETAPDLDAAGRWSFVRRGAPRGGVHTLVDGRLRRRSARLATETALTPDYVVFVDPTPYLPDGCCTVVRALRLQGRDTAPTNFGPRVGASLFGLTTAGRRAFWIETPQDARASIPLDPQGRGHRDVTQHAEYRLPATVRSVAASGGTVDLYLDDAGVKRVDRPLFAPLR